MNIIDNLRHKRKILFVFFSVVLLSFFGYLVLIIFDKKEEVRQLISLNNNLAEEIRLSDESISTQIETLELQNNSIQDELNLILERNQILTNDFDDFSDRAVEYLLLKKRISDYNSQGIDLGNSEELLTNMYSSLLEQKYEEFDEFSLQTNTVLDENKIKRQNESLRASLQQSTNTASVPTPVSSTKISRNQYSWYERKYIETEVGRFLTDIVFIDLNNPNLKVITDTVDERDNCWDTGCGAKSLGDYVSSNRGFAGIHGSYFCPPDYVESCANIPYSFDLATYNTRLGKWINPYLKYKGLLVFNGKTPSFYYNREDTLLQDITVTAGIANHPPLLAQGNYVFSGLDSKQASVRGYRGGIGYVGRSLYLVVSRNATVPDLAYVMNGLGIENALNLDGGGSSALFYDGYKVGPGRLLPNAIIFTE